MSLKVTVEIVPFGAEEETRNIGSMVISREQVYANPCDYKVVVYDKNNNRTTSFTVEEHHYEDGAWELVRRAIEDYESFR